MGTKSLYWIAAAALVAACGGGGGGGGDAGNQDGSGGSRIDAAPAPYCTPTKGTNLKLTLVASGLNHAVGVAAPVGDPRVFAIEQVGRIRVIKDGNLLPDAYIDVTNKVNAVGNEQGLLGLAFHPNFAQNGRVFVFYTSDPYGDVTVSEFGSTPSSDVANPTEKVIMTVERRMNADNHNGGTLQFGTDGFLYISVGDGGASDNYYENGQNPQSRMAKILRIDVDHAGTGGAPYAIPPSNPWAAGGGVPEMFVWGLRNPWRFSIDPATGDMFIGDVGQGWFEEVNYVPAGQSALNFGWAVFEGPDCFTADPDGNAGCNAPAPYTRPLVATDRRTNGECSVVGGWVYRGTCMPDLAGTYFFGDYCGGKVRTLKVAGGQATEQMDRTEELDPEGLLYQGLSSFGIDGYNELYVTQVASGRVYRIEVE
jgi:glucose/arabinose dehydrogenase